MKPTTLLISVIALAAIPSMAYPHESSEDALIHREYNEAVIRDLASRELAGAFVEFLEERAYDDELVEEFAARGLFSKKKDKKDTSKRDVKACRKSWNPFAKKPKDMSAQSCFSKKGKGWYYDKQCYTPQNPPMSEEDDSEKPAEGKCYF